MEPNWIEQAKKEEISTKTPADIKFEEMQQYANNLDIQMQNVARHTTALVKKQEQLGSTMFEFGVAFSLLANVSERLGKPLWQQPQGERREDADGGDAAGGGAVCFQEEKQGLEKTARLFFGQEQLFFAGSPALVQ